MSNNFELAKRLFDLAIEHHPDSGSLLWKIEKELNKAFPPEALRSEIIEECALVCDASREKWADWRQSNDNAAKRHYFAEAGALAANIRALKTIPSPLRQKP